MLYPSSQQGGCTDIPLSTPSVMPLPVVLSSFHRDQGWAVTKFLIFEEEPYDLKRSLSDTAGQDVEFHRCDYETVIKKVRNFFRVEASIHVPGPARIISDYATFQGWMMEKKISEGHSPGDAINLPTRERLEEMQIWIDAGKPATFTPP
jgi:hypothetical protein